MSQGQSSLRFSITEFRFQVSPGILAIITILWYVYAVEVTGSWDTDHFQSLYNVIHLDDFPLMDREWEKLMRGESVSFEVRLRRPFIAEELVAGEKVEGDAWIIAAAYPEKAEDGTVTGVLGCLTDISRQKWVEGFQTRRMLEAVELRRQQENFIGMTSQYAHFLSPPRHY